MPSSVYTYKKNKKTGKLEKDGGKKTLGNKANKGGGYTKDYVSTTRNGVTVGLPQVGTTGRGAPIYGETKAQSTVPNYSPAGIPASFAPNTSTPAGPAYSPPPTSSPVQGGGVPASFEPNTSTPGGPVYSPPPGLPLSTGGGAATPQNASFAPQQSSTQQGQQQTLGPQMRSVSVVDKNGVMTTYRVDPTKSFISQTGQYEFDFWTPEGQRERIANAAETSFFTNVGVQFSSGEEDPTSIPGSEAVMNTLNAAALVYGATAMYRSIAQMSTRGAVALTPTGAQTLAGSTKAAATGAGQSPKVTSNLINAFKRLPVQWKAASIGSVIGLMVSAEQKGNTIKDEQVALANEMGSFAVKLRATGDPAMINHANELMEYADDITTGYDQFLAYVPIIGRWVPEKELKEVRLAFGKVKSEYDSYVVQEGQAKLLEAEQQKAAAAQEQQNFQRQQQEDSQQFQREEREARQQFEQQNTLEAARAQLEAEALALEDEGSSTLNFGLLGTSGAPQYVDRDAAAKQLFFGRSYEELTPEQKRLLELLKGGN